MLEECEGCLRKDNNCKIVVEEDPHFKSLRCPCFECLLKVVCVDKCSNQYHYMWRRVSISYDRLEKLKNNNKPAKDLVRDSL